MKELRSGLYLIGQIVSAVIICFAMIICYPFPKIRDRVIKSWAHFNLWTLGWLCGVHYRVRGLENIPTGAAIIISNHQSAWETLFFQLIFPPLSFVLKRQLLWIPFFGWGLAAYHPIAIDRSKKKRALDQLITQGKERLDAGRCIVIYPEGTRMAPGSPGKFQIGGAMIAAKTAAPIIPIAHNGGVYWAKRGFIKYPGTIDVVIGMPIVTEGRKARDLNQQSEEWIKQTLETLPKLRS